MVSQAPHQHQRRRILIASDSFLPRWDGVSRFLSEIIPQLSSSYDITVLAPHFSGELKEIPGINTIRFHTYKWRVADIHPAKIRFATVKHLVRQSDIVWSQTLGPIGAASMLYAKKYHKPLIAFIHSIEWDLFSKSLKRFQNTVAWASKFLVRGLYNKCSLLMVPSENIAKFLEAQGINAKKEIVYLGTDVKRFAPTEDKRAAKKRIGIDPTKLVVGYVGRFGREKDLPTLYEAFRRIVKERSDVILLLVGGTLDTPFENMENVKVFGPTNNVVPYFQAMDIYVLPSLTETTSLTTMEAMSCGLPVVVTPVGYIANYVRHRVNGFLFPTQNVDRLEITLRNLIDDKALREKIGKAARKTIVSKYAWDKTAAKIAEILEKF
ncbi:glycosyltransferase family 4 protein [Candidatus Woesearchaeota archaeon]|nr:glycosyltransferase family 4 protein [Candidatus Woesearchaeota archaeon]